MTETHSYTCVYVYTPTCRSTTGDKNKYLSSVIQMHMMTPKIKISPMQVSGNL